MRHFLGSLFKKNLSHVYLTHTGSIHKTVRHLKYTLKKQRLKITQPEKVHFINVNELKIIQIELFSFFHFKCAAAYESGLFCMAH